MLIIDHISDMHFGIENLDAIKKLTNVLRKSPSHFIAVSGDLTMDGLENEYILAQNWLNSLNKKYYTTIGNHDIPKNPFTRILSPRKRFNKYFGETQKIVKIENETIAFLDSTSRIGLINWERGRNKKRSWKSYLSMSPSILVVHHPIIIPKEFKKRIKSYGKFKKRSSIKLVLSGHSHKSFSLLKENTLWVGCGTSGSQRIRSELPSFNRIYYTNNLIKVEVFHYNKEEWQSSYHTKFKIEEKL